MCIRDSPMSLSFCLRVLVLPLRPLQYADVSRLPSIRGTGSLPSPYHFISRSGNGYQPPKNSSDGIHFARFILILFCQKSKP